MVLIVIGSGLGRCEGETRETLPLLSEMDACRHSPRRLTKGVIPTWHRHEGIKLVPGYQWLTTNPDFDQAWCRASRLPYKRNEVRLTVKIPDRALKNVQRWLQYCVENPDPYQDDLNCYGDPENWVLYRGNVNPIWIKRAIPNPAFCS